MHKQQATLFDQPPKEIIIPKVGDKCLVFDGKNYHEAEVYRVSKKTFCAHAEKESKINSFIMMHIPFSKFRPTQS